MNIFICALNTRVLGTQGKQEQAKLLCSQNYLPFKMQWLHMENTL